MTRKPKAPRRVPKHRMRTLLIALLVMSTAASAQEPKPAPPLRVTQWYNSEPATLESLKGNVVLLDFWATWCMPCRAAQPKIEALAAAFEKQPFRVIMVHTATTTMRLASGSRVEVPASRVLPEYLPKHQITLPVAVAASGTLPMWGAGAIPHYVLVDKQGRVRYSQRGALPGEAVIRELLAE